MKIIILKSDNLYAEFSDPLEAIKDLFIEIKMDKLEPVSIHDLKKLENTIFKVKEADSDDKS